jgi:NAD(P)-dependent dehydrogenase (short-subunit alcohol dehydrogenase family)
MSDQLAGRVAIVTGGGRGLGRAHALELAGHGATVVIADPGAGLGGEATEESPAESVAAEIAALGGTGVAHDVSVTDSDGVQRLVAETVERFGRLDVLVNNAGITRDRMIVSMTERDWDDVIGVHLKGTFNLTRHAALHWRSVAKAGGTNSGRIINTVSGTGLAGNPGQSSYGAAKAAIANLTLISAMELERYGVTVNAIAPLARTRMTEGIVSGEGAGAAFDPLDPANASPVVAYLATEASGWLNGQVIRIDGGTVRFYRRWQLSDVGYTAEAGRRLELSDLHSGMRALYGALPLPHGDRRLG